MDFQNFFRQSYGREFSGLLFWPTLYTSAHDCTDSERLSHITQVLSLTLTLYT